MRINKKEVTEVEIRDLVEKNPDFIRLSKVGSKFNPFDVLRLKNYEIRHSNMLAWLFDPNGSHSLKDLVARMFVCVVYEKNVGVYNDVGVGLLSVNDLSDLSVYREVDHIDLLLVSESNNLVVLVENKWHAKDSPSQLRKYLDLIKAKYEGYKIMPLYLTLYGDPPSNDSDIPYGLFSYADIINILDQVLDDGKPLLSSEIRKFIVYYNDLLKEKLGMDKRNKDIQQLCREVYKKHQSTIDKIYEFGNDRNLAILEAIDRFCSDLNLKSDAVVKKPSLLSFVPNELALEGANFVEGWSRSVYAVACWFEWSVKKEGAQRIKFHIEVGPFADDKGQERLRFLELIKEKGLSVSNVAKNKGGGKYTKIGRFGDKTNIRLSDTDKLYRAMKSLYEGREEDISKIASAMKSFDFSGC